MPEPLESVSGVLGEPMPDEPLEPVEPGEPVESEPDVPMPDAELPEPERLEPEVPELEVPERIDGDEPGRARWCDREDDDDELPPEVSLPPLVPEVPVVPVLLEPLVPVPVPVVPVPVPPILDVSTPEGDVSTPLPVPLPLCPVGSLPPVPYGDGALVLEPLPPIVELPPLEPLVPELVPELPEPAPACATRTPRSRAPPWSGAAGVIAIVNARNAVIIMVHLPRFVSRSLTNVGQSPQEARASRAIRVYSRHDR